MLTLRILMMVVLITACFWYGGGSMRCFAAKDPKGGLLLAFPTLLCILFSILVVTR